MNYDQVSELNADDTIEIRWKSGDVGTVNYRGRMGNQACVWTGTIQLMIPCEWIIRKV